MQVLELELVMELALTMVVVVVLSLNFAWFSAFLTSLFVFVPFVVLGLGVICFVIVLCLLIDKEG